VYTHSAGNFSYTAGLYRPAAAAVAVAHHHHHNHSQLENMTPIKRAQEFKYSAPRRAAISER
jgi:hypothetical protein